MKKTGLIMVMIITLLLSLTAGGCSTEEESASNAKATAQNTTAEKKTDAKPDSTGSGNAGQQTEGNVNQYTNNVSTDKKPSLITLVKVQVNNNSADPFHVSLDGQVGASAVRLVPGSSTMLQKEVYQTGGRYPIALTISRNGEAVAVINQNLNSSNVSVVITETAPNQLKVQWN